MQGGKAIGDSLWTYNVTQENITFLTFLTEINYDNCYPKYSPDGSKIVFQSQLRIPNGGVQVMLMDSDGGNLTQLTTNGGFEPAWTHNDRIVYVHFNSHRFDINNGTLWDMNPDGSGKRQLTFNHGLQLVD